MNLLVLDLSPNGNLPLMTWTACYQSYNQQSLRDFNVSYCIHTGVSGTVIRACGVWRLYPEAYDKYFPNDITFQLMSRFRLFHKSRGLPDFA